VSLPAASRHVERPFIAQISDAPRSREQEWRLTQRTSTFTPSLKFVCKIPHRWPSGGCPDLVRRESIGTTPSRDKDFHEGSLVLRKRV